MDILTGKQTTRRGNTSWSPGRMFAENFTFSPLQALLLLLFIVFLLLVIAGSAGIVSPILSIGALGAAGVLALSLRYPVFALILVCLGAGLPSLLVPVPGHTMRPVEGALFLCVGLILFRRPKFRLHASHIIIGIFFLIAILSFIHVPQIGDLESYGANKRLFSALLMILAFFVGSFLTGYIKDVSSFITFALLSTVPTLLIGMGQALKLPMPELLVPSQAIEVTQEGRLSGPSDSPTTFAYAMVVVFAVAVACWLLGTRRRDRLVGFVIGLASAAEILLSGTRMASALVLVILIVALLVTRRFKTLMATGVMALIGIALLFDTLLPKFLHGESSDTNRYFLWGKALHLIYENLWIGIGMSQFPNYYQTYIVSTSDRLDPAGISVHNQYLEWAMESGILWLVAGVLLMLCLIVVCWRAYRFASEKRVIYLATILMVLGYMGICLTDVPFDKVESTAWLFLIAGIAVASVNPASKKVKRALMAVSPSMSFRYSHRLAKNQADSEDEQEEIKSSLIARMADTGKITLRVPTPYMRAFNSENIQSTKGYLPPPPRLQSFDASRELTIPLPAIDLGADVAPNARKTSFSIIIQLISWAVAIPIIFPTTAMLTRILGPVRYGEYNFTLTILAICALLSLTGMDPLISRYLSRQKREQWSETLSDALSTRLVTGVVVAGLAALVTCFIPMDGEQRSLLLLGYGTLLFSYSFNCVRCVYETAFGTEQRVGATSLLTTINRMTTAGLIALAAYMHFSFQWTYVLIAYSDIPYFIILLVLATRRYHIRLRFRPDRMLKIIKESLVFTGHDALALLAGQIDVLILQPLGGALSVGIYSLALRITNPLMNIVYAYVSGLFPYLSRKFEEGFKAFADLYYESTRILALGIIPLAVFVVITAPQIVGLIAGPEYTDAIASTQYLMIGITLGFFTQLAVRTCMAANKENIIPLVTAITLVINIGANIILITMWSATGAAIAAVISEGVSVCLFSLLLVRNVQIWRILRIFLQIILGTVPGAAFLIWQEQLSLFYLAPVFFVLVLVGCLITRAVSLKDVQLIRQVFLTRAGKNA
ncbi:oligosaccharide flippase family protein [Ktedonospora formicarum]|uniref:O-antigen ligase-related domain-containing protein n=1 Tax=Ktedonospora formicarum TaxID=2778364 RepID=A0A8J3MU68_9CHLR|nr:oligosaccharide flippase family protein [Ktedonospora formicarum]GHO46318.1 hypothetical protein KSX_44810 [Ktedonospora formicarum]